MVYPQPENFIPERWFDRHLGNKETSSTSFDPLSVAFGYGTFPQISLRCDLRLLLQVGEHVLGVLSQKPIFGSASRAS